MSRFMQVTFRNDIVSIEDRAGFVSTDRHCHTLRNTGSDQVSDACAPEIMKKPR
jgi:hypothetical protein